MLAITCGIKSWVDPIDAPGLRLCHSGMRIMIIYPILAILSRLGGGPSPPINSTRGLRLCVGPVLILIIRVDLFITIEFGYHFFYYEEKYRNDVLVDFILLVI